MSIAAANIESSESLPPSAKSAPARLDLTPVASRIQFLGLATGIVFLLTWFLNFAPWNDLLDKQGTPLGGDFCMFYLGGQIVAEGDVARLYDLEEHHQRLRTLFPSLGKDDLLPYRYPPVVAGATSPLARLPFAWSWGLFAICSLGLAIFSWFGLQHWQGANTPLMKSAALALCGWPVALEVIVGGQASFFALAIAVGTVLLIDKKQQPLAGAVLAFALYKPNVLVFFVLGCLLRFPRLLWGFIPVATLLALGCLATAGWEGCLNYVQLGQSLVQTSWEIPTPFWKIHGLISWLDYWSPAIGRPAVLAAGLAAVGIWVVRSNQRVDVSSADLRHDLALLVTLNVLFNPYPPIYDLVLLVIPAWISLGRFEESLRTNPAVSQTSARLQVAAIAGLFLFGPHFSQALSWQLHGQVFTIPLLIWAAWQWKQTFEAGQKVPASNELLRMPHAVPRIE